MNGKEISSAKEPKNAEIIKTKLFDILKSNFGFSDNELKNIDINAVIKSPKINDIIADFQNDTNKLEQNAGKINDILSNLSEAKNGDKSSSDVKILKDTLKTDKALKNLVNEKIESKNSIQSFEIVYKTGSDKPISSETKNKIELVQNFSDIKIKIVKVNQNTNSIADNPINNINGTAYNKPEIKNNFSNEEVSQNIIGNKSITQTDKTTNSQINHIDASKIDIQKEFNSEIKESREANIDKLNKISTNFSNENNSSENSEENSHNFNKNFSTGDINLSTKNTNEKLNTESVKTLNYNNIRPEQISKTVTKIINNGQESGAINAKLNLYPKALGRVFVEINISDDNAKIKFKVDSKETLKTIENQIGSLKDALKQQGIHTDLVNIKMNDDDNLRGDIYGKNNRDESKNSDEKRSFSDSFRENRNRQQKEETSNHNAVTKNVFKQGSYIEQYI